MQRRSFRASTCTEARYPRLVELGHTSGWGALALGGILLGGAACTPGHAAPGSDQAPKSSPASEPHRDGGAPPLPPPQHTAGVPMPQRIEPPARNGKTEGKIDVKTDGPKKEASAKHMNSAKKAPQDGGKKDTTSTPNKPKTKRTP